MRTLLLSAALLLLPSLARADDMATRADCKHPSCTCVDAEASHDCLDPKACAAFCDRHGGVAETVHSGYNPGVKRKHHRKTR